ncbi:succinate--CoA ligase subunit beta [Candidatus Wirthbacteria bacterium CG2_30_54_11]|uniref:Succinate--CoA ligase subunit beta n=1 Tax=Candidatus Wirthbacteria bacterium CG2_30_54_11 TaxID=1817892 RepID=A0A1J5ITK7_9BACT|nr:MAG: succinate--CoA ligase subunit beta [Candidatus Wirthbacteria bacterium CG2_30_54_11]
MDLKEFQGKNLYRAYDIPLAKSVLVSSHLDTPAAVRFTKQNHGSVVKAQILSGKRGKAGGVKLTDADHVEKVIKTMLGSTLLGLAVDEVLVEEKLTILKEYYLSITFDKMRKSLVLIFSTEGGVDIEETAHGKPEAIKKIHIKADLKSFEAKELAKSLSSGLGSKEVMQLGDLLFKLVRLMRTEDATLVEINPLMLTDRGIIAADSKMTIDGNSLYRHKFASSDLKRGMSEIERKAQVYDINYVELDGNIGVIGNGAGLVMCTLDVLEHFGGKPANFLDIGGGANVEKMEESLELILMKPGLKAILINIFGGITRCDLIAQGLVNYQKARDLQIPIVMRMVGTNEEEGNKILEPSGIKAISNMDEAAQAAVELAR